MTLLPRQPHQSRARSIGTQAIIDEIITLIDQNGPIYTRADLAAYFGVSTQMMAVFKRLANEDLATQGLCIPKPIAADGWVWKIGNRWDDDIEAMLTEMLRYSKTHHATMLSYTRVGYHAPEFNRLTNKAKAVKRLMHVMEAQAVAAEDVVEMIQTEVLS